MTKQLVSWLVVQWSYDVLWLFNECCNSLSNVLWLIEELKPLYKLWPRCIHSKRVHSRHQPLSRSKQRRVYLAPEQIEFDGCGVHWTPTARRTGLANTFVGHVKLRSSNLESINNKRCFQILKSIAQSWHIKHFISKTPIISIMRLHSIPKKAVPLGFLRRRLWLRWWAPLQVGGGLLRRLGCLGCLGLCQASLLGTWGFPKQGERNCENTEIFWEFLN